MAMYQEEPHPEPTKGASRRSHDGPQIVLKKHIIESQSQKDVSHGLTAFYPEPSLPVSLFQ